MGILDKLFGATTKTTKDPYEENPWGPQQEYLTGGFQAAQDALKRAQDTLKNTGGSGVAQLNQGQRNQINAGAQLGNQARNTGRDLMYQGAGLTSNFGDAQARFGGIDGQAQQLGQTGNQFAGQMSGMAGGVGGIINDAGQVASNPFLQGQIDNAIGDVSRGFQQQQSQINANASGAGGMNSTRAALMESRALEGAQRTAGNISSQMRSDAYNTGLNTSLQNKNLNSSLINNAGQMALNGQGMGLDAQMQNNQARMQLGQAGADMAGMGYSLGAQGTQDAFNYRTVQQQQRQAQIDGRLNNGQNLVNNYMSAVNGNYGSNGFTSSTHANSSPFQQIVGGTAAILGAGAK